jgi:hypothetical protein
MYERSASHLHSVGDGVVHEYGLRSLGRMEHLEIGILDKDTRISECGVLNRYNGFAGQERDVEYATGT